MATANTLLTVPVAPDAVATSVVLFDQDKFDAFYEKLKADIDATPVHLDTKKGRDAIASAAAKVRSEKASIDRDRKRLTKEWRDNTALVNSAWKNIETRLDELAVQARKPLTEWEEAEKARFERCQAIIDGLGEMAVVRLEDTAETIRQRGRTAWSTVLDADEFGDKLPLAEAAKAHAIEMLKTALARVEKEEADRAELQRLRAQAAERERVEAERVAEEERKAREAEEQRIAAERKAAAEKAEAERIERAQKEAEEKAKREAEAAAEAERARIQREHDEALAAERRRAEEAERTAKAERDRIAAEESARKEEAKRVAAEQAAREADKAHRRSVKTAAKEAIIRCGVTEDAAQKVVLAILADEIPNVTLRF